MMPGIGGAQWLLLAALIAMSPLELRRLEQAGLQRETVEVYLRVRAAETGLMSPQELIALKRAGVSEELIRAYLRRASFLRPARRYGQATRTLDDLTPEDLLRMKRSGLSDRVIGWAIRGRPRPSERELKRALRVLRELGIVVDLRRPAGTGD